MVYSLNIFLIGLSAKFTNIHQSERRIIYMQTGLERKNWRGGFNEFNVYPLVACNTLLIYCTHLYQQGDY